MQAVLMKRRRRLAIMAALVVSLGGLMAFALLSGGAPTAQAAVRHAAKHAAKHANHHVMHHDARQTADSSETSGDAPGDQQPAGGATDNNSQGECTGDCVQ